jgi:type VI secretion system secreted protein Hcp
MAGTPTPADRIAGEGASMAQDIFARIGDIKGESLDARHKDEIDVLAFSWGVAHTPSSGAGTGKAIFEDLSIEHRIDKATPALFEACATGRHIKDATITHRKAGQGQQEYLTIKLTDVVIAGVSHTGATDQPYSEIVNLTFAKVDLEYRPQKADGSLGTGLHFKFDLNAHTVG